MREDRAACIGGRVCDDRDRWHGGFADRREEMPILGHMHRSQPIARGPFPFRTPSMLSLAGAVAVGLLTIGCETSNESRSKLQKSSIDKKSSAKSPVKWESSSTQTIEENVEIERHETGYDGQQMTVTTIRTSLQSPGGGESPMLATPTQPAMAQGAPPQVAPAAGQTPTTPPVMLGVRMRAIDPVLATHLGVDPRGASVLEDVAEELNGHAGGLRDHDVIVAVDGKTPADPGSVRKALRSKKPGETIDFTVIRPGGKTDVKITLEAFDHGKFMSATPARVGG